MSVDPESAVASDLAVTVLARCVCKCRSCRFLHVGPLHMQLQLRPMFSCWPTAYAAAAAADVFVLVHCIYSFSCCRCLRVRPVPFAYATAAAADAFVLARCKCNCRSCRCTRVGHLHMQLQQLPMPSCWPFAYAAAAAADAFTLALCIRSWRSCRYLRVSPLHTQLELLLMPSCWPTAYATAEAADALMLAICICSCSS